MQFRLCNFVMPGDRDYTITRAPRSSPPTNQQNIVIAASSAMMATELYMYSTMQSEEQCETNVAYHTSKTGSQIEFDFFFHLGEPYVGNQFWDIKSCLFQDIKKSSTVISNWATLIVILTGVLTSRLSRLRAINTCPKCTPACCLNTITTLCALRRFQVVCKNIASS